MDTNPRGSEDVQETLQRYDQRISDLERTVAELKAQRMGVAQTAVQEPAAATIEQVDQPAQTVSETTTDHPYSEQAQRQPMPPALQTAHQAPEPATTRQEPARPATQANAQTAVARKKKGGISYGLPVCAGLVIWWMSGFFLAGALVAVVGAAVVAILNRVHIDERATGEDITNVTATSERVVATSTGPRATEGAERPTNAAARPPAPPTLPKPPRVKSDIEESIGRYWYLWTGVCLLVVGLGYGLMLAYEHVGPLVKVLSWLAGAGALVAAGEYAQRKMDFKQFGLALIGGGYAVAYFTIYALQNVASVKLLDNVVVDSSLLLALAGVCMGHSMWKRSESVAILSSLLAFVTLSLSTVTAFSVVAAAIMVVGLAVVIVRMRWFNVYLVGTVGAYLTFALFTSPAITGGAAGATGTSGLEGLLLSGAFLTAYWLVFSAVMFFIREPEGSAKDRAYSLGISAINAGAFVFMALSAMGTEFASWRYLFLFATGAAYFAYAFMAHSKRLHANEILYTLTGLMLATAAIPLWLNPQAVSAVWLLEVPLLVIAGLAVKQPVFRVFAAGLTVHSAMRLLSLDLVFGGHESISIMGWSISWSVFIGVIGVIAYALSAEAYRLPANQAAQHKIEQAGAYRFYFLVACAVAWLIPAVSAGGASQSLWFAAEAAALIALSVKRDDRVAEAAGAFFALSSAGALLLNYETMGIVATCVNVALFYAAGSFYRWNAARKQETIGHHFYHAYALLGIALTWALTALDVGVSSGSHLPLWLCLESALVVAAGFASRDSVLRQAGGVGLVGVYVALIATFQSWTWANTTPVVAALYALSFIYRYAPLADGNRPRTFADAIFALGNSERMVARFAYALAGGILLFGITGALAHSHVEILWALEAAAITAIGFTLGDREWRYMGTIGFIPAAVAIAASFGSLTWVTAAPLAAIIFAMSFAWRWLPLTDSLGTDSVVNSNLPQIAEEREWLSSAFAIAGAVFTTAALYVLLQWQWLAVAWSVEAIVLLTVGVKLNDRVFRYSAHAIFGLMLAKVVLWDLRDADQVVRVVTFVVAGAILIAAAWIFSRFEKKLKEERNNGR